MAPQECRESWVPALAALGRDDNMDNYVTLALHHVIRRQGAGAGIVQLDLQGGMADRETMAQLVGNLGEESVARMPVRHHQMAGQRRVRGAHRPDMKIVSGFDTRQAF